MQNQNECTLTVRVPEWMYRQVKSKGDADRGDGKKIGMGHVVRFGLLKSETVVPPGKKKTKR